MKSIIADNPLFPYPTHLSVAAAGALLGAGAGIETAAVVIGAVWLMLIIGSMAYHRESARDSNEVKMHD